MKLSQGRLVYHLHHDLCYRHVINGITLDAIDNDKLDLSVWEELVIRLLSETIKIANDDEWNIALGDQMSQQIEFYKDEPELKVCYRDAVIA